VTPRGALQVDGATESAVPQVGRIPVTLPLTFDDDTTPEPFDAADTIMRTETLRALLATLSERERRVLELRNGLNGQPALTLDEIGLTFNVTRERIRQIEHQSLRKLRALPGAQALSDVA